MQTQAHNHARLLTFTNAAKQLGVSRSTFYTLVKSGELPVVTVGKFRRVARRALRDYERAHTKRG